MAEIQLERLGDFLEATGDAAWTVAGILNLVVTKSRISGEAMCGIPVHHADEWIAELERAGHTVTRSDGGNNG